MTNFREAAKNNGFFASGNLTEGYRIAVRNKTAYKAVAAFTETVSGTISTMPTSFPALTKITFPNTTEAR